MRFEVDKYEPQSPYYVEVEDNTPSPYPFMKAEYSEGYIESVTYKTTIYVSGKRKVVKHHEPRTIPGGRLLKDNKWVSKRRHSNYSAQYRFMVIDADAREVAALYLDELEHSGVYDLVLKGGVWHIEGEGTYEKSTYAGFLMQEVSVEEIKRLKQELKTQK
ncbi:hypothetical protein [Pontibacter sp. BAB1700]|uniref:hypothetical protein n=1 Tax=Pontibacter sp. BAB1700 TaxID=1144253 RepID=UPI00026BD12F|nr:hypothetical protein [Pontibacter sp. BAB1700]EJF11928.1 hypothetical protein O71_00235 [Pontibacter sp. BAB1700]